MADQWQLVGKIKDPHGLGGEVVVLIFSGQADWKNRLKTCLLSKSETLSGPSQEMAIERIKGHKLGLQIKFKNIQNRNQSEALVGQFFYIPSDLLISRKGETIYLREILHFQVIDETVGSVGLITDFSSNGPQDLLVVTEGQKKYEIPFVQAFIKKISFEEKTVYMSLPPGLLELENEDL
ncbi:MAG: ribosome maturation factor RimM [Oligoflexia bacterium]|nr:MAG: ribosome maturation factor RimM [Oligoflexia bacterium]